jgi:hypothetical protein
MSAPHPTDVEVSRALNALVTTINDQGMAAPDPGRMQEIVTGSLGGEERILVAVSAAEPGMARLTDGEHHVLARVERRADRWISERVGSPLSGGYIPSAP